VYMFPGLAIMSRTALQQHSTESDSYKGKYLYIY
jgi:hypothetical protein